MSVKQAATFYFSSLPRSYSGCHILSPYILHTI